MFRQLQSAAIVVFFAVMMFMLARDHVIPSFSRSSGIEVDRSVLTDTWVDQDEWLEVSLGPTKLGRLRTAAEAERSTLPTDLPAGSPEPVPEVYTSAAHLELGPGILRGRLISIATLNRRLELSTVRVRAFLPGLGQAVLSPEELDSEELPKGAYELVGRVEGGDFLYRLRRDDAEQYGSFRLGRPVTVSDSITPILRGNLLTPEVTYTVDMFDPLMGEQAGSAEVEWVETRRELVNKVMESLRVVELRYQGVKTRLFVDQTGTVQRREIPLFASTSANGPIGDDAKGASLIFTRVPPDVARDTLASISYMPEVRPVTEQDVRGTNRGEVISGISAFGLLGGNIPGALSQLNEEN